MVDLKGLSQPKCFYDSDTLQSMRYWLWLAADCRVTESFCVSGG